MATSALIPGGGGDPWEWHRLVPQLASRGHDAIAVRLPAEDDTAGWSEYADTVVDAVGDRADVILVAASMGGFTAPIVCSWPIDWRLTASQFTVRGPLADGEARGRGPFVNLHLPLIVYGQALGRDRNSGARCATGDRLTFEWPSPAGVQGTR